MAEKPDWQTYIEQTKEYPPSPLLVKALPLVQKKEKAIDIGGGALKDSRFLLNEGFDVTEVDAEKAPEELTAALDPKKFHAFTSTFADFDFPKDTYDLASAMFSLPFNPPDSFDRVMQNVKASIHPGGILCLQLFGDRDGWSKNEEMTFHTSEQAKKLFDDMELVQFEEREYDARLASGEPKHWHLYNVIARKR